MADYHPLIARAVASLEKNTGENRRALYERARTALVAQLRGVVPALDESEITRERLALEEAIRKVEAESARQAREAPRPPLVRKAEPPRRPEPPRPAPLSPRPAAPAITGAPPSTPPRPMRPPLPAGAAPLRGSSAPTSGAAPVSLGPPRTPLSSPASEVREPPQTGSRRTLSDEALRGFRDVVTDPHPSLEQARAEPQAYGEPPRSLPPAPSLPPPQAPLHRPLEGLDQLEPQMQPENLWALPLDGAQASELGHGQAAAMRPGPMPAQEETEAELTRIARPPRAAPSYGRFIRLGLALVLVGLVGALVYWQRDAIVGTTNSIMALVRSPGTPSQREAQAPVQRKITDRIGQPTAQPSAGVAVAQRVVLYEEDPEDPQGRRYVGNVVWRTEMKAATPGRPPELVVRADVEVPERQMTVTWSLRRNTDQSLPASHTIEIMFNLPQDSPSGGVQNVPGVLMKQAEQTRGVPLAGLAVKVTPGFFLIGLSALEADMQRNVQLLKERSWFDIPIVYNNNRRAILAMEKGTPGEKAFNEAFALWKQ